MHSAAEELSTGPRIDYSNETYSCQRRAEERRGRVEVGGQWEEGVAETTTEQK